MLAWLNNTEVELVRRNQRVATSNLFLVQEDVGLPACALQREAEALAAPCRWDFDLALVPRDTEIMFHRL